MSDIEINDKAYWDNRFQTDWESNHGREQSRFFGQLAVAQLPSWFSQLVRAQKLTICDWGCAEGDGTDVLSGLFGPELVSGVDFSAEAIERARSAYPHIRFSVEDWVESPAPEAAYDVVFSSNTLEHFHNPVATLERLLPAARKCVALLLPFREMERHPEHYHTFLASNLAYAPSADFVLAHASVIDSGAQVPSYWPGYQILLIYVRPDFAADAGIVLEDIVVADERALEWNSRLQAVEQVVVERDGAITELNRVLAERDAHIAVMAQEAAALEQQARDEKERALDNYRKTAKQQQELTELRDALLARDGELSHLHHELHTIKGTRGWKYLTQLHLLRKRLLPSGSIRHQGVAKLYRGSRFLARSARNANATNLRQFVHYLRHYGPSTALAKTRSYLSRVEAYQVMSQAGSGYDIHEAGRSDELKTYLRERSYKGVFVMGSCCMGWHEVFKQRHHHIADYLMDSGYLVLCAMNPVYAEDFTECLKRDQDNLFLVNFDDRGIWRQVVDLLAVESKGPLYYHLVGTEPGTTLDDIGTLKKLGYTFVYDYLDEISKEINPALSDFCLVRHDYLLHDEDILLVTSADNLYEKSSRYRSKNLICTPNGVRLEDWVLEENPPIPAEIASIVQEGKPIVGYYGSFAVWMNYDYIKALSAARPDVNIVMIGYDYDWGKGAFAQSRISELPNVHILPAQKYYNLKYFSRFFDAGIVPFREYELTKSVSPVKMFEYMAQGIPVVASGMDECRKYASCQVADSAEQFVEMVNRALGMKHDSAYMAQLQQDAEANTWKSRGKDIEASMLEMVAGEPGKLLSIVIPTYNMEKLLPRCIESMVPAAQLERLEIIVVNDGSKDASLDVAREYEQRYPGTVRVFDKENGGHGSCINVGIREATGKYFKIVDADDWLDPVDLTMHMNFLARHDSDMVVTNYLRTYDDGRGELVSYTDRLREQEYQADDFYRVLMVDNSNLSYAHMHAITYRTKVLQDNEIRITEKSFYVDQEYISLPQRFVDKINFEDIVLYRYYIGRPGQSVAPDVARKRAPDNYKILQNIIALFESLPAGSQSRAYVLNIAFHHTWFYLTYSDDSEIKQDLMEWWKRNNWALCTELNRNFRLI